MAVNPWTLWEIERSSPGLRGCMRPLGSGVIAGGQAKLDQALFPGHACQCSPWLILFSSALWPRERAEQKQQCNQTRSPHSGNVVGRRGGEEGREEGREKRRNEGVIKNTSLLFDFAAPHTEYSVLWYDFTLAKHTHTHIHTQNHTHTQPLYARLTGPLKPINLLSLPSLCLSVGLRISPWLFLPGQRVLLSQVEALHTDNFLALLAASQEDRLAPL